MANIITINDEYTYRVESTADKILLDDIDKSIDYQQINAHTYHVLYEHKSYVVEVVSLDRKQKQLTLKMDGCIYNVALSDPYDALLRSLGMEATSKVGTDSLKAPMPGMVLDILVQTGQAVQKGENLLILEAMKMENIIKSPTDGIIKSVEIKKGTKVEKNQVLLTFE